MKPFRQFFTSLNTPTISADPLEGQRERILTQILRGMAILGALLIDLIQNSLFRWAVISQYWLDAILGMMILLAVALDYVVFARLKSIWARAELQMSAEESKEKAEVSAHVS